jgi:hypothetical protein
LDKEIILKSKGRTVSGRQYYNETEIAHKTPRLGEKGEEK